MSLRVKNLKPKSVIRRLCANIFLLSSVFPFIGYNGTTLRPQNVKNICSKIKYVIIITLMTDLG